MTRGDWCHARRARACAFRRARHCNGGRKKLCRKIARATDAGAVMSRRPQCCFPRRARRRSAQENPASFAKDGERRGTTGFDRGRPTVGRYARFDERIAQVLLPVQARASKLTRASRDRLRRDARSVRSRSLPCLPSAIPRPGLDGRAKGTEEPSVEAARVPCPMARAARTGRDAGPGRAPRLEHMGPRACVPSLPRPTRGQYPSSSFSSDGHVNARPARARR